MRVDRFVPIVAFVLAWFSLFFPFNGRAQTVRAEHIEVELVSLYESPKWGQEMLFAIRAQLEDHWHIYWRNPGDSGTAPNIVNLDPSSWQLRDILWPYPKAITVGPLVNFGYEGIVYLPFKVRMPDTRPANDIISLQFKWLVCKEVCIPGEARLEHRLPPDQEIGALKPSRHAEGIQKALARNPQPWTRVEFYESENNTVRISLELPTPLQSAELLNASLFPYETSGLAVQGHRLQRIGNNFVIDAAVDMYTTNVKNRQLLLRLDARLSDGTEDTLALLLDSQKQRTLTGQSGKQKDSVSLASMAAFAFLGGLILNLMPCVFPILSIKVFALIAQRQKNVTRKSRVAHSLAYSFGVLLCFWILLGALLLLKQGGQAVGWGFQLQSPVFVGAMSYLFFFLALSFLDLIEPWNSLTRLGNLLPAKNQDSWVTSLGNGLLAVLVASPCTAPFMGAAMGYALARSGAESWVIFSALALGFALPFAILGLFPSLLSFLPKPGPWMQTLKQFFAFPLLLTMIWLLWVLGQQAGLEAIVFILLGLCGMAFLVWMAHAFAGRWPSHPGVLLLLGALALGACLLQLAPSSVSAPLPTQSRDSDRWLDFMVVDLQGLKASGPVFIDFTAAWCVSCQVNKRVALEQPEVLQAFDQAGVTLVRADWTDYNPKIADFLAKFNRSGVPLYLLYPAGAEDPIILPELLTPSLVKNYLKKL